MKKKILQRKVNLKRTCLVIWGLLMMQTAAFAIEHVHPEINFCEWRNSNNWKMKTYNNGAIAPLIYSIPAWDFSSSITLENGDVIDLFYCINDEDPSTVSLAARRLVCLYNEFYHSVYNFDYNSPNLTSLARYYIL